MSSDSILEDLLFYSSSCIASIRMVRWPSWAVLMRPLTSPLQTLPAIRLKREWSELLVAYTIRYRSQLGRITNTILSEKEPNVSRTLVHWPKSRFRFLFDSLEALACPFGKNRLPLDHNDESTWLNDSRLLVFSSKALANNSNNSQPPNNWVQRRKRFKKRNNLPYFGKTAPCWLIN